MTVDVLPAVWGQVPGQEQTAARLAEDVVSGRVAHAYLLTGAAGSGLRQAALAFAAALVCPQSGCGTCRACTSVRRNAHPDVEVIEPAGMQLLVDQVRDVARTAWRRPQAGERRVVVVDQADRMTDNAQNAFLKALEEPPASAVIVLLASVADALLPTVRSRCRQVLLRPLSESQLAVILRGEGAAEADADLAARVRGTLDSARQLAFDAAARELRAGLARTVLDTVRDPGEALGRAEWLASQTRAVRDRIAEAQKAYLAEMADWYREAKRTTDERSRREQRRAEQDALEVALDDITTILRDLLVLIEGAGNEAVLNADLRPALAVRAGQLGPGRVAAVLGCLGEVDAARRRLRSNANVALTLEVLYLAVHGRLAAQD